MKNRNEYAVEVRKLLDAIYKIKIESRVFQIIIIKARGYPKTKEEVPAYTEFERKIYWWSATCGIPAIHRWDGD